VTDALETMLRPVAALLNRQIQSKTPARELCADLRDSVFALRVTNSALAMYIIVGPDQVFLSSDYGDEPDVVISGSLLALARLASPAGDTVVRGDAVALSGDVILARKFQTLLRYARPDFEEELSGLVGDAAAHSIGELVRNVSQWGREAGSTLQQNVSEYLQEESRTVPSRYEAEFFRGQVDTLRDDVARFEARLKQVESDLDQQQDPA
jgi:ubiquinone biosynthesis protein UbiJ